MDGKLTPPDLMEKTMVMSDVNEDLLREELSSSGTQVDSTTCPTELSEITKLSPEEDNGDNKKPINNDLHQTKSEDTFTIGSRNSQLHFDTKDDVNRALPVYVPWCKKNDPPPHPPALLPMRKKPRANDKTPLYSSTSRSSIKTTSCSNETHNDGKHTVCHHQ
ncbi:unnamed protein product [Arctogadus glacialis]